MEETKQLPVLPPRAADAHKGTFGRVLLVAGSRNMSGAAVLCGTAALRAGAGLVTVACPEAAQSVIAAGFPCYTTFGLPSDAAGQITSAASDSLKRLADACDVVAVGPGLGRGPEVTLAVRNLMLHAARPMVMDADALAALSPMMANTFAARNRPTVLTPHPGEYAAMTAEPAPATDEQRLAAAERFTKKHKAILVLKGHRTLVVEAGKYYANSTGNPGMATGGTGDVLTGILAALIGQGLAPFDAACLAVHVHGRAGDLAAADLGQVALTALDVLAFLPAAFLSLGS